MVVENPGDWRDLLTQIIVRSGYEVIQVDSGQDAIDQAAAVQPDLILLDFGLANVSPDQILTGLGMNPSTKNIPVIAQTMFDDRAAPRCAVEAGIKEVLYKPFDLSELPGILRKHLAS